MLSKAEFTCQSCSETEETLHVHHKQYFKGRAVWEYSNDELVVLCDSCHRDAHDLTDELKRIVSILPPDGPSSIGDVVAILSGFIDCNGYDFSDKSKDKPYCYAIGKLARFFYASAAANDIYQLEAIVSTLDYDETKSKISEITALIKGGKNA